MKRKVSILAAFAATSLLAGCAFSGGGGSDEDGAQGEGPVELTFQSLAFQDPTVKATKEIVADWNQANPDIQVKLRQGSWNNVQDQLVTQFAGGTAPDIIHYEASATQSFAEQGYLADLSPYLSDEVKNAVSDDVWDTVTSSEGAVIAAPTLLQSYVVFANEGAFKDAGVDMPKGEELPWEDLREIAGEFKDDSSYGVAWGLKQPAKSMVSTSLGFGGDFFDVKDDGSATIDVGNDELAIAETVHAMTYKDKSMAPVPLTQNGGDVVTGFLGGEYAMFIGANYLAQQITESAPKDFEWTVLPPVAGTEGAAQAANPQTLSVAERSDHVEEAAAFVDYFMGAKNLTKVALGDWLIPTSSDARKELRSQTEDQPVWDKLSTTVDELTSAPFQKASNYPQWDDQYATSAFQKYFSDSITKEQLQDQLTQGWESVSK